MTLPTVLIAVPAEEGAERAATAAVSLFGPDARYRFVHVAEPVPMTPPITAADPMLAPVGLAPADLEHLTPEERDATLRSARAVAAEVAAAAGFPDAEAVGRFGDPAEALIDEAIECGAGVIVLAEHHRSWLDSLLHHSVSRDLERHSPVPILVVPSPG